ncbi:MAG: DUF1684 domain-containing protein [Hyalangium sp.]
MNDPSEFEAQTRAWHAKRIARLTAEDGWLTLVGLHWLKEGPNRFGSAVDNDLLFPAPMPAHAGTFTRKGSTVSLSLEPGVALTLEGKPFTGGTLRSDAEGPPDTLALGTLRFFVIRRGERLGVRVKDSEAPTRKAFHGIPTYAPSPAWRVEARFEPSTAEHKLPVPNVLGELEELSSPGTVAFTSFATCPLPPTQNRLKLRVEAGEKRYGNH